MFNKNLFTTAILAAVATATTEIANSCITMETHLYGVQTDQDLTFNDYNYLINSEEFNTVYRMTRLQLCENTAGDLTGMRSHITRFNSEDMTAISRISMNMIGTTKGDDIYCNSIVIDAENGEYLTGMYIAYENPGKIDYIRATSNKNQQISKGTLTSSMNASEMEAIQDTRILAFHGYESDVISAIGQVSVELSCVKGVTTVETVIEEVLIDVTTIDEFDNTSHSYHSAPQSEMSVVEQHWYYIMVGAILGVLIMSAITVIGVMYKQKKGCFNKGVQMHAADNQVMSMVVNQKPQASDIEFAGKTLDQKRKSLKQMSNIVEMNETQEGDDIKKPHNKLNKDNFISNGQLQSVASMQQITDTDEPSSRPN